MGGLPSSIYYNVMVALNGKSMMRQGRHCWVPSKGNFQIDVRGTCVIDSDCCWILISFTGKLIGFSTSSRGSSANCRRSSASSHPTPAPAPTPTPLGGSLSLRLSLSLPEHTADTQDSRREMNVRRDALSFGCARAGALHEAPLKTVPCRHSPLQPT